jgi:hypothetical protein
MSRLAAIRGVVRSTGQLNTDAPGESITQRGIQLRTEKAIGSGDNQKFVVEFALNTGLLAAERGTIEEIATLTGKWRKKIEHAGADGGSILISVAAALRWRRAARLAREEAVALLAVASSELSEPETSEPTASKAV